MITKEQAVTLQPGKILHHTKLKRRRDGLPFRCRVNGKCKTWKTRPDDWRLPVKFGLRTCFYINPSNAFLWEVA